MSDADDVFVIIFYVDEATETVIPMLVTMSQIILCIYIVHSFDF